MQTHNKLSARILSFVLAAAMVTTMMPAMAFAVEGGSAAPGTNPVGTIQAFETFEGRFIPSTGENAPSHVYGLSVALNTPYEDLKLPGQLTAKVERTAVASAESKPAADADKPVEPAASSEAASASAPASSDAASSEATEAVKEEIPAVAAPLAPEAKPTETAAVTTVQQETIPVTWHSDKAYQSDANGKFVYTAVLPEGYILADGVQLPQIHVAVGKQARAAGDAISVTINGTIVGGGATLQAAIEASGVASVTSLKITAGVVTTADWNYLTNLTAMTSFEIADDPAVTTVADIPDSQGTLNAPLFPKSIVTVTVPQAIGIGLNTFRTCVALKNVSFPKITSTGKAMFYGCKELESISFPAVTSIGEATFGSCVALTTVNIPAATSIGMSAFNNCRKLASVNFPVTTSIGIGAFMSCSLLESATFPALTSISENAFKMMSGSVLKTLKLGATPPSVGSAAFENCPEARALGYVDAAGTDLTGTALAAAIAAYKAAAAPSDKWNGWTIESVPAAITVTINGTEYKGNTLQDAISKVPGGATAVTTLKITAGVVTTADWNYLQNLYAMTSFEIANAPAVTAVADMPNGTSSTSIFPKSIVSVTVPQAIAIGNFAVYSCTALTSASFPAATSIGANAFNACIALTSASFPMVASIGERAFNYCIALASVSFPAATSISDYAFNSGEALVSANFPAVTSIGKNAFADSTVLASASFPAATSFGEGAFSGCPEFATLKLGATPPSVGSGAFDSCPATRALGYVDAAGNDLTGDDLAAAIAAYKAVAAPSDKWNGWTIEAAPAAITVTINGTTIGGATLQEAVEASGGATAVTTLKITAGEVKTADWNYLTNLTAMTTFEIANAPAVTAVADLPDGAPGIPIFPDRIESVTVPQAIAISKYAFSLCDRLASVSFPAVTSIGDGAFMNCTALASASFPAVISIGESAFSSCEALASASFPAATSIGESAFSFCDVLASASFPAATSIGRGAFMECNALISVNFPAVTSIGDGAFSSCDVLASASFPAATSIGDTAFGSCEALASVNFPLATSISKSAFYSCVALTSASFPVATSVGKHAFYSCTALASASFPAATSIGDYAFSSCSALTTLKLGATPPTTVGDETFSDCPEARALVLVDANGKALKGPAWVVAVTAYTAQADSNGKWNGWTIPDAPPVITVTIDGTEYDGKTLQDAIGKVPGGAAAVTSLNITEGEVTTADWNYLKNLTAMTSFEIANAPAVTAVANIPNSPDSEISIFPTSIQTVTVPQAITIGNNTFYYCEALASASFPAATSIGRGAFLSCNALVSANFPAVTNIGANAFQNCEALASTSFPAVTSIGANAFARCNGLTSVSFPAATSIGDSAFSSCEALASVNFPAAPSIGDFAFAACKALTTVSFPVATSIGANAFQVCEALTTVSFPAVTSIGEYAFSYCKALTTLKLGATPPTLGANAFKNCPEPRTLVLVDANGNTLTGSALAAAIANYKTAAGGADQWSGWTLPVAPKDEPGVPPSAANGPYYTIVATAGPGGSLSTGQNVQVPEGDSAGFAITPNKGYRIADVVVNGKSVGAKNYYVFTNVRSNQTIHVTFTQGGHTNPQTGVK